MENRIKVRVIKPFRIYLGDIKKPNAKQPAQIGGYANLWEGNYFYMKKGELDYHIKQGNVEIVTYEKKMNLGKAKTLV